MPVVSEKGFFFNVSHSGTGYSSGVVHTIDHSIAAHFVSIHVGLSRVQATNLGPLGAAVGIMIHGDQDLGPNPVDWLSAAYGAPKWTVAAQVNKGQMTAWEFFQVWD